MIVISKKAIVLDKSSSVPAQSTAYQQSGKNTHFNECPDMTLNNLMMRLQ